MTSDKRVSNQSSIVKL